MTQLIQPDCYETRHSRLSSAVIIGAVTDTTARIWVRVYREGKWSLVLSKKPITGDLYTLQNKKIREFMDSNGFADAVIIEKQIGADTDNTAVYDFNNLAPDTTWYYALMTDDLQITRKTEIGSDSSKMFRTLESNPDSITFGYYSCNDPISERGHQGVWKDFYDALSREDAAFVIGGGDQVYVDTNDKNDFPDLWIWVKNNKDAILKTYKLKKGYDKQGITQYFIKLYRLYYRIYWNYPSLLAVYERFPQFMMWDDHEIMDGWGSLTRKERVEKIKFRFNDNCSDSEAQLLVDCIWNAACHVYNEYQHSHNPGKPFDQANIDNYEWDYSFNVGASSFYFLDLRGHHDVESKGKDKNYRILGWDQYQRFVKWINDCNADNSITNLFVMSSVPVVHWKDFIVNKLDIGEAKDDCMDEWDHDSNRKEKLSLLDAIFEVNAEKKKKVIILSGDVHSAAIFRLKSKKHPGSMVYQVTSSAISRKPAPSKLDVGISDGGNINGSKNYYCQNLFSLSGKKNFAMIRATRESVIVDLVWSSGSHDETSRKSITIK